MSFILTLENWEFSGYVEIIRKFLVLISVMKKNGPRLKDVFHFSLLHSRVVLMSSIATCDLMQWNVSLMTDSDFFSCLEPNIFQVLLSNLKGICKNKEKKKNQTEKTPNY